MHSVEPYIESVKSIICENSHKVVWLFAILHESPRTRLCGGRTDGSGRRGNQAKAAHKYFKRN